ncbi:glycosyl hydrolase family 18 protein [Mucilaginibacter glaciei]|uniref:chitinase n=1 Tax=Mucilaginibacter glaciei TaxID=2772109 RepID=A0A926NWN5_9SPHI|nr:glycosyl hydrolase family 18 protein [Mucilaginibacter glaciei]MBD1393079.1 hypothetical protein [Mucilaginibacter glaciei]
MIKLKCFLPGLLLLIMAATTSAQSKFRVVGYLRNQRGLADAIKRVNLDRITHLNIAFINPDSTGSLLVAPGLKDVVLLAHSKNVKVLLSIGGGTPPKYLPVNIYGDKQDVLITALTNIAISYNLDGIDVDLEGLLINDNYEGFVTKLAASLKVNGKLMTAAVATYNAQKYTDKVLALYDFINVMSYDKTGPWRPNKPGLHAPYEMAVNDLDYWINKRGILKEKISLGLPFYGYGFGADAPESMTYKQIVVQYPDAKDADQLTLPGGAVVYYNGTQTIKTKTVLALKTAGGVMVWQLLQDADGEDSMLKVIDDTIRSQKEKMHYT